MTFNFLIFQIESKLDNLNEFLSETSSKIDVIALTETSEKEDTGFLTNVGIFKCSTQVLSPIKEGLQFMQTRTLIQLRERILI